MDVRQYYNIPTDILNTAIEHCYELFMADVLNRIMSSTSPGLSRQHHYSSDHDNTHAI
jgi:hypothetical protein